MVESAALDIFASWHDFYMLTGSVAATLLGLIFVAVSLHLDTIVQLDEKGDVRSMASQIFVNFTILLSFSFVFIIPDESLRTTGGVLMMIGASKLYSTAKLWHNLMLN